MRLPRRRPPAGPGTRSGAVTADPTPSDELPPGEPAPAPGSAELGELVARVADSDGDRRAQLTALARGLGAGARGAARVRGLGALLADVLTEAAPRLRIRDAATLRLHHPGRTDDEIADALTRTAAITTAGFGAAVGVLAAAEYAAPPTLLAAPVQLAAETLAVAAVEVKLVAELHEIGGRPAPGTGTQRATAYLTSWVRGRALDPAAGTAGLTAMLGAAAKKELRTLLVRRLGRSTAKLAPMLAGAVAGGVVNRRATLALAGALRAELRRPGTG